MEHRLSETTIRKCMRQRKAKQKERKKESKEKELVFWFKKESCESKEK